MLAYAAGQKEVTEDGATTELKGKSLGFGGYHRPLYPSYYGVYGPNLRPTYGYGIGGDFHPFFRNDNGNEGNEGVEEIEGVEKADDEISETPSSKTKRLAEDKPVNGPEGRWGQFHQGGYGGYNQPPSALNNYGSYGNGYNHYGIHGNGYNNYGSSGNGFSSYGPGYGGFGNGFNNYGQNYGNYGNGGYGNSAYGNGFNYGGGFNGFGYRNAESDVETLAETSTTLPELVETLSEWNFSHQLSISNLKRMTATARKLHLTVGEPEYWINI